VFTYLGETGRAIPDGTPAYLMVDIMHRAGRQGDPSRLPEDVRVFSLAVGQAVAARFGCEPAAEVAKPKSELTTVLQHIIRALAASSSFEDISLGQVRGFAAAHEVVPRQSSYSATTSVREVFGPPGVCPDGTQ